MKSGHARVEKALGKEDGYRVVERVQIFMSSEVLSRIELQFDEWKSLLILTNRNCSRYTEYIRETDAKC